MVAVLCRNFEHTTLTSTSDTEVALFNEVKSGGGKRCGDVTEYN